MAAPDWQTRLEATLRLIPGGYDPWAQAEGCWLDHEAAQTAIDFFPECLRHCEGAVAGQPFVLEEWQKAIVGNLFGWKKRDSLGRVVRRFRTCFLYVPRKNGKTPLCAGICCYLLFCDGEPGAQIYCAAADREQAAFLFRQAKGMVEQEPELESRAIIYGGKGGGGGLRSIVLKDDTASVFRVLSADADTKHGGNSHAVLVDELHAQRNRDLVDVLSTSFASANRAQPLMMYITTADYDRESICNEVYKQACAVRDNGGDRNKPGFAPEFLPVIYEAKQTDDWKLPETWKKANPNYGVSVSQDYMEIECRKAQESPSFENTFRRLHLNQRTQNDVVWMSLDKWDACQSVESITIESLRGRPCYAGLDLSTTTDITAAVFVFPGDNGELIVWPELFVPEETMRQRERRDRVPYATWVRGGFMNETPGNVVDYDHVRARINELAGIFSVQSFAIDRWNATQIALQLQGDGHAVNFFGQGFKSMSPAMKALERAVTAKKLRHNGSPAMRWMMGNLHAEQDAAGNIKPSKAKSTEKIDGLVALIMAIGLFNEAPIETGSVYDTAGSLAL